MTQWVENPTGGRDRGPAAIARAWAEVLVRPRRFFTAAVAPGDQAPGMVFASLVAVVYVGARFALVPATRPDLAGRPVLSMVLALALVALALAPLALHFAAALCTLALRFVVADRAGVSETVQVIAYASAPCVFAAVPHPAVRLACALYASGLLVVGLAVVHRTSLARAALAGVLPALLVFGYGFGGVFAFEALSGVVVTGSAGA
ncbi:MAG: YIP1 family protein [Haloarculaceae archaeon]